MCQYWCHLQSERVTQGSNKQHTTLQSTCSTYDANEEVGYAVYPRWLLCKGWHGPCLNQSVSQATQVTNRQQAEQAE
jgi:hypothetical protein